MDHPIFSKTHDHSTLKPKTQTGLGWQEFFEWLGQGTVVAEHRSPLPKLVQE